MRSFAALLALTVIVVACGGAELAGEPAPDRGLATCEDVPRLSAQPDRYDDRPIYVGNEMPVEAVRAWAESQPGFEAIWIDRDHNGWVTVAFSEDASARQSDIDDLFPEDGVVAVGVEWTMAELVALQESLPERLGELARSSGIFVDRGVVSVGIGPMTEERVAAAESALAGERVCLEGIDPTLLPEPGPQPPGGDGWRLLAGERTGHAYRTGLATDALQLADLWEVAGVSAPVPDVDFDREVVIWFGAVFGSSCPDLRLDDVVVSGPIVHPEIVVLGDAMACTDDANPYAYVVAVERDVLPSGGFTLRLQADEPAPGVVDQQTLVTDDLTAPGATTEARQVQQPTEPEPRPLESGDVMEPGFPVPYRRYVHCGIAFLGDINGVVWKAERADGPYDFLPEAWRPLVDENQDLVVEVTLFEGDPPRVEAVAAGHTEIYRPTTEPIPGCD